MTNHSETPPPAKLIWSQPTTEDASPGWSLSKMDRSGAEQGAIMLWLCGDAGPRLFWGLLHSWLLSSVFSMQLVVVLVPE